MMNLRNLSKQVISSTEYCWGQGQNKNKENEVEVFERMQMI